MVGAARSIDGLTGAQRFFLSWAQAWQQKARDEEVIRLLAIDPHSPNEFRCNQIVRNIGRVLLCVRCRSFRRTVARPSSPGPHLVAGCRA